VGGAICAPLQSESPFATTSILRPSVTAAFRLSSRSDVRGDPRSSFPAHASDGAFQRPRSLCEDSDLGARRAVVLAVVAQAVGASSAATSLGRQRECEPEPAQQKDSELFARHDEVRSGGQRGECTICAFATLSSSARDVVSTAKDISNARLSTAAVAPVVT